MLKLITAAVACLTVPDPARGGPLAQESTEGTYAYVVTWPSTDQEKTEAAAAFTAEYGMTPEQHAPFSKHSDYWKMLGYESVAYPTPVPIRVRPLIKYRFLAGDHHPTDGEYDEWHDDQASATDIETLLRSGQAEEYGNFANDLAQAQQAYTKALYQAGKIYKGGQYMPGGQRAPAGGARHIPS